MKLLGLVRLGAMPIVIFDSSRKAAASCPCACDGQNFARMLLLSSIKFCTALPSGTEFSVGGESMLARCIVRTVTDT